MIVDVLSRLALRVADADYDPRHAVLDISSELQAAKVEAELLPAELASELHALLIEIQRVQPTYPSRRETSPLFDRAGLGQPGRDRAERILRRLISLSQAVRRMASQ